MSKEEKAVVKRLAQIVETLPAEAKTRILDYGEGMAAMVEVYKQREQAEKDDQPA